MPSTANSTPALTDLLCENCGYILNGLPDTGKCPECGSPIAPSTSATTRHITSWEDSSSGASAIIRFTKTTASIIFSPKRFYRNLRVREQSSAAYHFARIHWAICSIFFGWTAWLHADWYNRTIVPLPERGTFMSCAYFVFFVLLSYVLMLATTRLAARLSAWEGNYRGYRLPYAVVVRALYFHAAHFLPVALLAWLTVAGYTQFHFDPITAPTYLYVLCAEVILAAVWLFNTYWIGMRNLMYANY